MAIAKPARTNFVLDCQSNCTSVDWKHGSRPENTPVVQCDWTSRTKFVWAAFEQSSPSIPIAIDFTPAQRDLERELMGGIIPKRNIVFSHPGTHEKLGTPGP